MAYHDDDDVNRNDVEIKFAQMKTNMGTFECVYVCVSQS